MSWQQGSHTVDLYYIDDMEDHPDAEAVRLLFDRYDCRFDAASERTPDVEYQVAEDTHHWNVPAFHRLAREKQQLLARAVAEGYDAVWLVDSDLLCGPDTLDSLIAVEKPIASAVFWTAWDELGDRLPQVWQAHPYGFDGAGWTAQTFLSALRSKDLVRVRGLGACTLISRQALLQGCGYWPLVDGLPMQGMWQGEDRHFCVRAERLQQQMWADAWPEVWHCYRPSDREALAAQLDRLEQSAPDGVPAPGDWVNFTIEILDDARLVHHREHVRGRLGMLEVLTDIEMHLFEMAAGESRIIRVQYPAEWPIIAGQTRMLRLKLLGSRKP